MSIEAGVIIDMEVRPIFWHVPDSRSGGALPDSRRLWDNFWEYRKILSGFAHSHPGSGEPSPSHTDVTTFAAVEAGLGRRLDWWIISSDDFSIWTWQGPGELAYVKVDDFEKFIETRLADDTDFFKMQMDMMRGDSMACRLFVKATAEISWIWRLRELSQYLTT